MRMRSSQWESTVFVTNGYSILSATIVNCSDPIIIMNEIAIFILILVFIKSNDIYYFPTRIFFPLWICWEMIFEFNGNLINLRDCMNHLVSDFEKVFRL